MSSADKDEAGIHAQVEAYYTGKLQTHAQRPVGSTGRMSLVRKSASTSFYAS